MKTLATLLTVLYGRIGGWPTVNQELALSLPKGWASMMPVLWDLLRSDGINPHAQAFPRPALRKQKPREGRGTRSVGDASEIKSLGHPPATENHQIKFFRLRLLKNLGEMVRSRCSSCYFCFLSDRFAPGLH
jgi:hypothetical protein